VNEILRRPRQQAVPVRWWIFGFLFAIGFLEYLQQRALTIAAEPMIPALHLTQMQIGWLEQAFVIGYMLFQIPGGVLGQRWGARRMFVMIGAASVVCIVATVFAPNLLTGIAMFAVMFGAQFLMGVAQAPTFPVSTGVFETWFPPRRWPLVQGLQTMGLGFGAALAPPLIATLMTSVGWQQALLWTALPAIPLFLLWAWYARNSPREHAAVSAEELALLSDQTAEQANARVSLREMAAILKDRHVLLLTFAYFSMNYVFYLLGNWCFLYLVQERHFSVLESGWLATAPPIAAGMGAGIGGVIASLLYVRLGIRRGLRLTPLIALPAAGLLMLLAVHAGSAYLAIALLATCYGLVELTEGSFWAAAMTIGRRNTMAVGGVMNTGGSLGGVVGIPVVAYLSGHGDWNTAFFVGTGFAVLAAVTWLFIDASHVAATPDAEDGNLHPEAAGL
jgi:ACS family glucarate transporter-like MFS transporter